MDKLKEKLRAWFLITPIITPQDIIDFIDREGYVVVKKEDMEKIKLLCAMYDECKGIFRMPIKEKEDET